MADNPPGCPEHRGHPDGACKACHVLAEARSGYDATKPLRLPREPTVRTADPKSRWVNGPRVKR